MNHDGYIGEICGTSMSLKCIAPEVLGVIIRQSAEQPDHLAVPDITIPPMVPEVLPAV